MTQLIASQIIDKSGIAFGTSGARGIVTDFTPKVCSAFTLAFIQVLQNSFNFKRLALAIDNRPSSPSIANACIAAAKSVGIEIDYYGVIPTPALAVTSMKDGIPAIMVTGSHIPFDRNGLKFYRPDGEITKTDELAILSADTLVPELELEKFPEADDRAAQAYLERYTKLFSSNLLDGKRIGIYEHSSAGRDLYSILFEKLGATVISLGRSDSFVPIDTEAVSNADIEMAKNWQQEYQLDVIFSTDGDGDRPLLSDETGTYLRGDILCLLAAKSLSIEALSIPVSCNSAIELSSNFKEVSRTKIGSPFVIAAFERLKKNHSRVAGFEANGGFILGTDIDINGKSLSALPTRDAILPALAVLSSVGSKAISSLVQELPSIYTASDRLQNFSREHSLQIIKLGIKQPNDLLSQLAMEKLSVNHVDTTDGLRMKLSNNEVIHLRPSGNAPELRCYAESNTPTRAESLVTLVLNSISKSQ